MFHLKTLFSFSILIFAACDSPKTKPSTFAAVQMQPLFDGGGSGSGGGALADPSLDQAPEMTIEQKLAEEARQRDAADLFLAQRIDEEAAARIAEDKRLQEEIDKLWKELAALSDRLTTEVARLDVKDKELQNQLNATIADHQSQINELTAQVSSGFAAGKAELEATRKTLQDAVTKLAADTKASQDEKLAALAATIAKNDESLKLYVKDNAAALKLELENNAADLRAKIALLDAGLQTQGADIVALKNQLKATETALGVTKTEFATNLANNIALVRDELLLSSTRLSADIDTTKRVLSTEFTAALTNVKNDLLLADAQLATTFTNRLASDINGVKTLLAAQKTALEDKIVLSSGQARDQLVSEVLRLEGALAMSDESLRASLGQRAADQIVLRKDLEAAQAALTTKINSVSSTLTEQFTNADNALRMQLQAETDAKVNAVALDLNAFKAYADQTYATKNELKALSVITTGLQNATNLLGAKINATDARLTQETLALRTDFKADLATLQADVDSVKTVLNTHIATYQSTTADLYSKSAAQAVEISVALQGLQVSQTGLTALNTKMAALTARVTNTEFAAQEMRTELAASLTALEENDASLDAEVRAAKEAAAVAYTTAVGNEQALRESMRLQIQNLTNEIVRVEGIANSALQLSRANQDSITGLRTDLEAAKVTFQTQIDDLRGEFDLKIKAVRDDAEKMVGDLDSDTQRQLADFSTTLADLKARANTVLATLARILDSIAEPGAITEFLAESKPQFDTLTKITGDLSDALGATAGEFMTRIDVIHHAAGVPNLDIAASFKVVAADPVCGGITGDRPGEEGQQPAVGGKPWYVHLARAYTKYVMSGARSGDPEIDKILFGYQPPAGTVPAVMTIQDNGSLATTIALAILPSYALGAGEGCATKVDNWARALFVDKGLNGTALRKAIAESVRIKATIVSMISPNALALKNAAQKYENTVFTFLKLSLGTEQAVLNFIAVGSESVPAFRAVIADSLVEAGENRFRIAALEQNVANGAELAKEAAMNLTNSTARVAEIERLYASLSTKIDAVSKITPERIEKIESGLLQSFNLVAAIATRLGYEDIVQLARDEAGKINNSAIDNNLIIPLGINACSFYYNYALKEGDALKRCDSGIDVGNGNFGDSGRCRTIQLVNKVTTNTIAQTTVNTSQKTNIVIQRNGSNWQTLTDPATCRANVTTWYNWALTAGSVTGHLANQVLNYNGNKTLAQALAPCDFAGVAVNTVTVSQVITAANVQTYALGPAAAVLGTLKAQILAMDHPHALEVARRPEGAPYPLDKETQIVGRFYGNAYYIRATGMNGETYAVLANPLKTASKALNIYEVPISLFLAQSSGAAGFNESVTIEALDAANRVQGGKCTLSMNGGSQVATSSTVNNVATNTVQWVTAATTNLTTLITFSPIVLDLAGKGDVETINAADADVLFDFGAKGFKSRVGWIKPTSGFLVLDRNHNGVIDDGSEMFGDHTRLKNGNRASNGYEALAELAGGKTFIDASSAMFKDLRVWVDANQDGTTDKGELKTLASLGIKKIGAVAEDVAPLERAVAHGISGPNYKLYQNRFWGPEHCGAKGCVTFDVFFGTDHLPIKIGMK